MLPGAGALPVSRNVQVLTLVFALDATSLCPEVACYRYLRGFATIWRVCNCAGMFVFVYTLLSSLVTAAFCPATAATGSVYKYTRGCKSNPEMWRVLTKDKSDELQSYGWEEGRPFPCEHECNGTDHLHACTGHGPRKDKSSDSEGGCWDHDPFC